MPHLKRVSRLSQVPGIGVDKVGAAADAAHDPAILRLENLDTDLHPASVALDATKQAVDLDCNNSYLPFVGQEEIRKAAAAHVSRMSGVSYEWQRECVIAPGGTVGIFNCLLALIEPGDEVIVTDPIYAGIINRIRIAGGIVKFVPLIPSKEGWRLDVRALKEAASPKTKMIHMMSPSMPTGHVLNDEEWEAVRQVCVERDAWLLYNAAMERILFGGRKVAHPARLDGMRERTITVGSSSKELRMIGWRVGWIVGPKEVMDEVALVGMANVVCQVGIGMPGVAAALNLGDQDVRAAAAIWEKRASLLLQELEGLPVVPPHGGWSMLLDVSQLGVTPDEASARLLKTAKIAATGMKGWGEKAEKYLRLVFSNESEERLKGVGEKIKRGLS